MNSNQLFPKSVRKLRMFALTLFFALLATNSFGQTKVSGLVSDIEKDEPLAGVVVNVQGTKTYTLTDVDGKFTINAKPNDVLEFSFMGMKKQTIVVSQSKYVTVKMEAESVLIDNVVVTGFQTLSKERSTGSFAKVTSVDLDKYKTTNLTNKLSSTMNGVLLKADGNLEIRGRSTLNMSGNDNVKGMPLYVVDGFPTEGDLSEINPDEIESITVLRDAAAASIYGIKSANGVIVITRKAAAKDRISVTGSAIYSISEKVDLSYLNKMNAADAVDYQWEAMEKGKMSTILSNNSGIYSELGKAYLLQQSGDVAGATEIKNRLASYGNLAEKQYEDYLFRSARLGQYNVSISGANKNAEYFVSGRIEDSKSLYKGNKTTKYFLNARVGMNITKHLKFNFASTANYTDNTSNSPISIYSYSNSMVPYEPLFVNGEYNALYAKSISYKNRDLAKQIGLLENGIEYNPVRDMKYRDSGSTSKYYRHQFGLVYNFDFGLKLDVKYQYEGGNSDAQTLSSPQTNAGASFINRYAQYDGNEVTYNIDRDKSILSRGRSDWNSHLVRGVASYEHLFSDKHYLSLLTGIELQKTTTDASTEYFTSYDKVTGFKMPTFLNVSEKIKDWAGTTQPLVISDFINYKNSTNFQRYFSFFFNAGYTFNNKYNLTGSFRIDQSNIFGTDAKYRYKPMWSVGASWNIYKEDFMQSLTWINNLTLRATYGLTGMIDKSTSPYIIMNKDKDGVLGEYGNFDNAPNLDLCWEETKNFNIGIDYSVLKNRIGGFIEFYNKYTTDVIAPRINDPTNGFGTITANNAEISNRGIDFNIHSLILDGDLKWNSAFNFSTNRNKVEKLYVNAGLDAQYYTAGAYVKQEYLEGGAIDELYSYRWAGLNDQGYAQIYDKGGNILTADKSNNVKADDLISQGRTTPKYFGNFTNTFSWNNFTLAINITYKLGYKTRAYSYRSGYTDRYQQIMTKRWRKAGDEATTNVPGIHDGRDDSFLWATYGSQNTIDADHIRLKFISLSYSLPKPLLSKLKLSDVTFNLQVENVGILWRANNLDIDPEEHASWNGDQLSLPARRTYSLGVNIKF